MVLNPLVADILRWITVNTNRCTFSLGHSLAAHQDGAVSGKLWVCVCVSMPINETESGGGGGVVGGRESIRTSAVL